MGEQNQAYGMLYQYSEESNGNNNLNDSKTASSVEEGK